jgi:translation initiation factor 2D
MGQLDLHEPATAKPVTPLSPSEVSTLLDLALVQAISEFDTSALPMPASLLYSSYVLPNRPSYIPKAQREDVVIAKSEWKKLAKWMKEASKDGIIKTKESKGEVTVTG